jgi:predicted nucleic acid-binding protein
VNLYLDSSALLRLVLAEAGALQEVRKADLLVSSELLGVESRRTIDRLRHQGALSSDEAVARLEILDDWLEAVDLVLLRAPILNRAAEPLPMPLGTLDALHLATALVWRDRMAGPLTVATHDTALALAARAFGFGVLGGGGRSRQTNVMPG